MGLGALLTAYANVISDWIINECDETIEPDAMRVLRYHGHPVPDDIQCSPAGLLSVWWEPLRPKASGPCPVAVVTLDAKFAVCWKVPTVTQKGITLLDPTWDEDAGRLADIAECVTQRLIGLVCLEVNQIDGDEDPFGLTFREQADRPSFVDAAAGGPQGGVAWITWRIQTGVRDVPAS